MSSFQHLKSSLLCRRAPLLAALVALAFLQGCGRGRPAEKPAIHMVPDMDAQPKYLPQAYSTFFEDHAAMRQPIAGTVPRGWLRQEVAFNLGIDSTTGAPVRQSPVPITLGGLQRGQERFNIYCSPCHSRAGDGQGIMVQRGYVPPPSFHSDLLRGYPDGHIFAVITGGIRNMPGYGQLIPVADRWLIINYLRALQRSQQASMADVPEEIRQQIK